MQQNSDSKLLLSEFCLFSPGSIRCLFGSKFVTVVHSILRYVHVFSRNFSKSFQILKIRKAYRVQVHPGAKMNFRTSLSYILAILHHNNSEEEARTLACC